MVCYCGKHVLKMVKNLKNGEKKAVQKLYKISRGNNNNNNSILIIIITFELESARYNFSYK